MGKFIDMTGEIFGRLTVLSCKGKNKQGTFLWECICSCEHKTKKIFNGTLLRNGGVKSCGCLHSPGEIEYLTTLKKRLEKYSTNKGYCIEWNVKNRVTAFGYGYLNFRKKQIMAHRASWIVHKGKIPEGMWVLHKCDNPPCINPDHLFLGSCKDNIHDMINKKRDNSHLKANNGIKNHFHRLTDDDVRGIRIHYLLNIYSKETLCDMFNIGIHQLNNIISGRAWKHLINHDMENLKKGHCTTIQAMIESFFYEPKEFLENIVGHENKFWNENVIEACNIILKNKRFDTVK